MNYSNYPLISLQETCFNLDPKKQIESNLAIQKTAFIALTIFYMILAIGLSYCRSLKDKKIKKVGSLNDKLGPIFSKSIGAASGNYDVLEDLKLKSKNLFPYSINPNFIPSALTLAPLIEKSHPIDPAKIIALKKHLDLSYKDLPWPKTLKNVTVFSRIQGGLGDASFAIKLISMLQKESHFKNISIQWVIQDVLGTFRRTTNLKDKFIALLPHPEKIKVQDFQGHIPHAKECQLLIDGPVLHGFKLEKDIIGPYLHIEEITHGSSIITSSMTDFWRFLFVPSLFAMGLSENSGVFINEELLKAPLSLRYSCPSYISKLQDEELKTLLIDPLTVGDKIDFSLKSFNFGYAHQIQSHLKFIDTIVGHEKIKDLVYLCNRFTWIPPYQISFEILKKELIEASRLVYFKEHGFCKIILKTKTSMFIHEIDAPISTKTLSIILYDQFLPADMKYLQLASDRLLTTGDNTAIEAWASRCKLYVYEALLHKLDFLDQQERIAKRFSPHLSRLLKLFGNKDEKEASYREKIKDLLIDDTRLSEETYSFCLHMNRHYNLKDPLMGFIKRAIWQSIQPSLVLQETAFLKILFLDPGYLSSNKPSVSLTKTPFIPHIG